MYPTNNFVNLLDTFPHPAILALNQNGVLLDLRQTSPSPLHSLQTLQKDPRFAATLPSGSFWCTSANALNCSMNYRICSLYSEISSSPQSRSSASYWEGCPYPETGLNQFRLRTLGRSLIFVVEADHDEQPSCILACASQLAIKGWNYSTGWASRSSRRSTWISEYAFLSVRPTKSAVLAFTTM